MAFKGSLKEFDISSVFQFIQGHQQSGKLEIRGEKKHGYFLFSQGNIVLVWESETSVNRILIQYLLAKGRLDQNDVRYLLDVGRKNLGKLVDAILQKGFLDDPELHQVLQGAMMDLACSLAAWQVGSYEFRPTDEPVEVIHHALEMSPEFVTLEAMRRMDEILEFRKILSDDMVLKVNEEALGNRRIQVEGHSPLRHPAVHLLILIDGESTIGELMRKTFLMEYRLYEVLLKLHQRKIIEKVTIEELTNVPAESEDGADSPALEAEMKESKISYSVIVVLVLLLVAVSIRLLVLDGLVLLRPGGVQDPLGEYNAQRKTGIAELQYEAENGVETPSKSALTHDPYYVESRDIYK